VIPVAAVLVGAAAWLLVARPVEPRLASLLAREARAAARSPDRTALVVSSSALAGVGAWVMVGGLPGIVVGLACAVLLPRLLGRLESRADRARRDLLERQAPLLADLMSATLASGATLRSALDVVGRAIGEPTSDALRSVVAAIDLGADPVSAWRGAQVIEAHGPVVDAVVRASESGAPVATVLARVAADLRRDRALRVEVAARSAGVRAVAPLAACFLPAFLLMGVVPVVASLAGSLLSADR
jgi:Flp pilus assembly protein TadB